MTELENIDRDIQLLLDRRHGFSVAYNLLLSEPDNSPASIAEKVVVVPRPAPKPKPRPTIESRPR